MFENKYEFLISDWDQYRYKLNLLKKIAKHYPGDSELHIKSYESEVGLTFIISDIDVLNKDFQKKLLNWRAIHISKKFTIGIKKEHTLTKENLIKLKQILQRYIGLDTVEIKIYDKPSLLELKTIKVDSKNPDLHKEIFQYFDHIEQEDPFS